MIKNLPKNISSKVIEDFNFGNQEAIRDTLLEKCFCNISPVKQFLKGDKDYLLGVKGSGKSAIFRQLVNNNISFDNENNLRQIIVPIDQDVDYLSVKYHLHESLESVITDDDIRARFIWEIYILYRVITTIFDSDIEIDNETKVILDSVINQFSFKIKKPTIIDLITKADRTIGCKIDVSHTGFPVPDFYIKAEPKPTAENAPDIKEVTINMSEIQTKINSLLRRQNSIVYVLIDNLDDFLAREAYDAQRLVIQGLLACSKDYSRHTYIKIKSFLRNEVFHKVDFEQIGGAEKIKPNAIDLKWSPSDIRRFVAERLQYNLFEVLHLKSLNIQITQDDLYKRKKRTKWIPKKIWDWLCDNSRKALDVTELDFAWRTIITCFFPRTVQHYNDKGVLTNGLDFFEYIETHFCMANSNVTPRAILIYLDKLLQISTAYYSERLFPNIELNEDGEYPLFLRDHILLAYRELQGDLTSYISSAVTHPEWKDRISSLLTNIDSKKSFSFRELRRLINYDENDQDAKELLAFLEHLGVVVCENKSVHLPDRKYLIPLILQKAPFTN